MNSINNAAQSSTTYDVLKSVTSDGVKTYSQLFDELYSYRSQGAIIYVSSSRFQNRDRSIFYSISDGTNSMVIRTIKLLSTGSTYYRSVINSNGSVTFSDDSSSVPSQGIIIELRLYM